VIRGSRSRQRRGCDRRQRCDNDEPLQGWPPFRANNWRSGAGSLPRKRLLVKRDSRPGWPRRAAGRRLLGAVLTLRSCEVRV